MSPTCSTSYTDVVYHRPLLIEEDFDLSSFDSTFVDFLTRHRLLPLVRSLSLPNFQIVREFYVNFLDVSSSSASLFGIVVYVRGFLFHSVSILFRLPLVWLLFSLAVRVSRF